MSESNHLPKANHLRFSIVFFAVIAIGLCIVGVQKIMQARVDADLKSQHDEYAERVARRNAAQQLVEEARTELQPNHTIARAKSASKTNATQTIVAAQPTNTVEFDSPAPAQSTEPSHTQVAHVVEGVARGTFVRGTITGTARLLGTPPPEKVIEPLRNDPVCGKFWTNTPTTRFYVVNPDGGLANVFVYINEPVRRLRLPSGGTTKSEAMLDQTGCQYEPYVLGVVTGEPLHIRNSDPVLHNVHATPQLNQEFNFAQPTLGQVNTKVFSRDELFVRFKCDVHPWMFAYVGVVLHPFFAVTDSSGHFELNNLPAGRYQLAAVHPKAGRIEQEIVIGNEPLDVTFDFRVPAN